MKLYFITKDCFCLFLFTGTVMFFESMRLPWISVYQIALNTDFLDKYTTSAYAPETVTQEAIFDFTSSFGNSEYCLIIKWFILNTIYFH